VTEQDNINEPNLTENLSEPSDDNLTEEDTPQNKEEDKSVTESIGIDPNTAALLCYLFLLIGGVVFYILEKKNQFLRFAAMQSILLGSTIIGLLVIIRTFQFLAPSIFDVLTLLLAIVSVATWGILMYKAFNNQEWELPIIGKIAKDVISK
jgi:uncharacterized membrane protein